VIIKASKQQPYSCYFGSLCLDPKFPNDRLPFFGSGFLHYAPSIWPYQRLLSLSRVSKLRHAPLKTVG
jgi:hypothetical protein